MSTRKISISQLSYGMFIHELDIPWMQSPFLRHRRKIKSADDIALLKQAGVKKLYIDLSRGLDVLEDPALAHEFPPTPKEQIPFEEIAIEQTIKHQSEPDTLNKTPLAEEIKVARVLRGKICQVVEQLSHRVKDGQSISAANLTPVIEESIDSISRNDQALLTLLHLHRQDLKLNDHAFGVFSIILPLAIKLSCTKEEISHLAMAALLHDIGWARLPMQLLDKKKAYSAAEKKLIPQHISIVEGVLKKCNELPDIVKTLIVQHHESNDGSGYPNKLTVDKINKLTQILQVSDVYDESIHGLMGRQGMLPVNALKKLYLLANKGLYSKTIVAEMIHVMGVYPLSSAVELSSGEKALVVETDKRRPLYPKVKIIYNADGQPCSSIKIIDLAIQHEHDDLIIIKVIDPSDKKTDPLGLLIADTL